MGDMVNLGTFTFLSKRFPDENICCLMSLNWACASALWLAPVLAFPSSNLWDAWSAMLLMTELATAMEKRDRKDSRP